jgi:ribonuclease VapC
LPTAGPRQQKKPVSKVILDTSAFLAFANRESGADKVRPVLKESVVSAVNAAEILQKLVMKNMTLSRAEEYLKRFVNDIPPFDLEHAALTATMHSQTREFGLSLGDRACLALGMQLGLPIMTADQVWLKLGLGISIELIRENPS